MKRVLILGAGLVAPPMVHYLLETPGYDVTLADRAVERAASLVKGHKRGRAVALDIEQAPERVGQLVEKADLVVSLLPYTHHPAVARECLKHKKHLVTSSYVSDAMRALDNEAKELGLLFLNEMGLDPGIDHMSAQRIIDDVHERGGEVVSFRSFCGGLPAPDANDNPFGYKFSWSPRGVVMAGQNDAKFLEDGVVKEVPGKDLFASWFPFKVEGAGEFEAYPNRNSLPYVDVYGIQETKTMFRGTLRYPGWCPTWRQMVRMGLLDKTERPHLAGKTFADLTRALLELPSEVKDEDLRDFVARKLGQNPAGHEMAAVAWLGYFGQDVLPQGLTSPFEILLRRLEEKLPYRKDERDMIVLVHEFIAKFKGGVRQKLSSTLIAYGAPGGDSAMSRTVSLPAAIGVKLILEGAITLRGVQIPVHPNVYRPVLAELEKLDIRCSESTQTL